MDLQTITCLFWEDGCKNGIPQAQIPRDFHESGIGPWHNLNTQKPASLYKRYPQEEARRILRKLETHYTQKHGSLLDIAEIELNMMARQCLKRRIDNIDTL